MFLKKRELFIRHFIWTILRVLCLFSISVVYLFCCVQLLSAVHVRLFAAAGRNIYCMSASVLYARLFVAVLEVERLCG
jgi:hypothetical protein